jgi:hypothetical protein
MERAAWIPYWYGLDQPLAVGATDEFAFWKVVPEHFRESSERLVLFQNDLWKPEAALIGVGTIAAITNAELGEIRAVEILEDGFEYAIRLADGTRLIVDSEQELGRVSERSGWSASRIVTDWRCVVDFESLSELRPAEPL